MDLEMVRFIQIVFLPFYIDLISLFGLYDNTIHIFASVNTWSRRLQFLSGREILWRIWGGACSIQRTCSSTSTCRCPVWLGSSVFLVEAVDSYGDPLYFLMAGPTSFAPIIEMAMTIVEQSGGQYHILLIIADGQVNSQQYFSFCTISMAFTPKA